MFQLKRCIYIVGLGHDRALEGGEGGVEPAWPRPAAALARRRGGARPLPCADSCPRDAGSAARPATLSVAPLRILCRRMGALTHLFFWALALSIQGCALGCAPEIKYISE